MTTRSLLHVTIDNAASEPYRLTACVLYSYYIHYYIFIMIIGHIYSNNIIIYLFTLFIILFILFHYCNNRNGNKVLQPFSSNSQVLPVPIQHSIQNKNCKTKLQNCTLFPVLDLTVIKFETSVNTKSWFRWTSHATVSALRSLLFLVAHTATSGRASFGGTRLRLNH